MAFKTRIFTLDKGQTKNQSIDDFTGSLVSDAVRFYTTSIANNGVITITVGYDDSLRVITSSPVNDSTTSASMGTFVGFNNTFNTVDISTLLQSIEWYENNVLQTLSAANLSKQNNTLVFTPLASGSGKFIQLLFKTGMLSDNNKKLTADYCLTWRS